MLLDTNSEIASELTKEKTKYRLIPCLFKGGRKMRNVLMKRVNKYGFISTAEQMCYFPDGTPHHERCLVLPLRSHGTGMLLQNIRGKNGASGPYFMRHVYNILLILYIYCDISLEK